MSVNLTYNYNDLCYMLKRWSCHKSCDMRKIVDDDCFKCSTKYQKFFGSYETINSEFNATDVFKLVFENYEDKKI